MTDKRDNTGNFNSGYHNSGDYNTGYHNSGDYNTGYYNSGNRNSGDFNSGDYNSGYFNSNNPKARLFNKDTDLHFDSVLIQKIRNILKSISPILTWIYSDNMSDEEKAKNPTYETTGGYLKKQDYKYCWQKGWEEMSDEDRQFIKSLPNFCPIIFEEITGINIAKQEPKKKITLELTQDQIDKIQDIINN